MKKTLLTLTLSASTAYGINCQTDCKSRATISYRYPCGVSWRGVKTCRGRMLEPAAFASCKISRESACMLQEHLYHTFKDRVKAHLEPHFNADTYAAAAEDGETQEYLAKCEAAGVAVCAAIGAEVGGPWGAAMGGAVGVFISYQLCRQSTRWD